MVAGLVLGRDQQKEDIDGLAVQSGKLDAPAREGDRSDQALEGGMPGMGNGDAHADAGRAELFAAQDGADDALDIVVGKPPGFVKASDHFTNRLFFRGGAHDGPRQNPLIDSRATKSSVTTPDSTRLQLTRRNRLPRPRLRGDCSDDLGNGPPCVTSPLWCWTFSL